jgi:nucleotide-binding universal stress UspA family protein
MFNKILVPLDGSELSERALAPALALAQKPGGIVTLLRVPLARSTLAARLEGFDSYVKTGRRSNIRRSAYGRRPIWKR